MLEKWVYFCFLGIFGLDLVFCSDSYITKSVGNIPSPLILEDGTFVSLPLDTADSTQGDLVFIKDGIETTRIWIDTVSEEKKPYFKKLQEQARRVEKAGSRDLNYFEKMWERDRFESFWAWPRDLKYDYEVYSLSQLNRMSFNRSSHTLSFSLGIPYLSVGGHIKTAQHSGGIYPDIVKRYSGRFNKLGWGFSISAPVVRYELRKHSFTFPEYGWLDPQLDSLFINEEKGSIVSIYGQDLKDSVAFENVEHRLSFRLSHLQYTMIFDADYYNTVLHEWKVTEVSAGFLGEWDLGVILADSKWYPMMGVALFPFSFQFGSFSSVPYRFKVIPSKIQFGYVNTEQFFLSWSLQFKWNNPGRALLGGKF